MNLKKVVKDVFQNINSIEDKGKLAAYIPELANIDPRNFGVHISTTTQMNFGMGNFQDKFSIQSIAKVFSLCLAYKMLGESIWNRLGVEPSGSGFNSLIQLETNHGIPRNPFINAGAIVISDILISNLDNPKEDLLSFIRSLSADQDLSLIHI